MSTVVVERVVIATAHPAMAVPAHPVSIFADRRPGRECWAALPYDSQDLALPDPDDPDEIADFWCDLERAGEPIGRGATPNEALAALQDALNALGGYDEFVLPPKYRFEDAWGR
jgi:hypothetical protein